LKTYWKWDLTSWDILPMFRVGRDSGFCGDDAWYVTLAWGPAEVSFESK
jgi:hypothetical protein